MASLLARLQQEQGEASFCFSPVVGSCFRMLGFVPTGLEKSSVTPNTLHFKKFNNYRERIDRAIALLTLLHHGLFSSRMGRRGKAGGSSCRAGLEL